MTYCVEWDVKPYYTIPYIKLLWISFHQRTVRIPMTRILPATTNASCFMPPVFIVRRQLSNHSVLVTCPQSFTPGLDQALGLQMSNIIIIIIINPL